MKMRALSTRQFANINKGKVVMQTALAASALLITMATALANPDWKDVSSGMQVAKQMHKYVLADVYTDWCGWCKKLDRDTFSDPDLSRFLDSKFVCVKANAEDNGPGQRLAAEYGVNGYPCALVFDQDGKLIGRVGGYKDAQGYESALTKILEGK